LPSNLEPLLPDLRVTRIEHAIRARYPGLPYNATFSTYYQDEIERDDGRKVPPHAAFLLMIPNPRHPQFDKTFTKRVDFKMWRQADYDVRHDTIVARDPAFPLFAEMAREAMVWYTNVSELTPLPKDFPTTGVS
jgi:hypothetical protein